MAPEVDEVFRAVGQGADFRADDGGSHRVEKGRHGKGLSVLQPQQPPIGRLFVRTVVSGHRGQCLLGNGGNHVIRAIGKIAALLPVAVNRHRRLRYRCQDVAERGCKPPQVNHGVTTLVGAELFLVAGLRGDVPLLKSQCVAMVAPPAQQIGLWILEQPPRDRGQIVGQGAGNLRAMQRQRTPPAVADDLVPDEADLKMDSRADC